MSTIKRDNPPLTIIIITIIISVIIVYIIICTFFVQRDIFLRVSNIGTSHLKTDCMQSEIKRIDWSYGAQLWKSGVLLLVL